MKRVALAMTLALAASAAVVARAGPDRGGALPAVLLRLQGHVGAARPGDRGLPSLPLRHDRDTIAFQVDEVWVRSGNLVGNELLQEVEPYTPNMSLAGPAPLLERLAKAPPEEPLEVTGYFRLGARILMVSAVETVKPK